MKLIHWVENQLGGRRSKSSSCSTRRPSGEKEPICEEGRKRSDSTATSSSFFFSPSSAQTAHYNHGGSIHDQEQIESTTTSKNMNVICGQRRARSESRTGEKILSFVRMDHSSFSSTPRKGEERKGEERKGEERKGEERKREKMREEERKGENEKEESTTKRGRKRSCNKKSKEEKEERLTLQELRELLEQSYQQELKEREERMLQRSPALVQRSQQRPENTSQQRPENTSQQRSENTSQQRSGHTSQQRSGHKSSTLCHESYSNNKFQSSFNSNLSSGGTFTRDQEERERWIKNTTSVLGNTSLNQKKSSTLISISSGEKSSSKSFRKFPGSALFSSFRRQNSNIETGPLNGNIASKNSVFMSQRVTQHVPHNTPSTLHPYCLGTGKKKTSSNFSSSSSSSSASPFLPSFSSSSPFDPKCTSGTTTGHDGSPLINFPSLTPAQEEEFLTILFPSSSGAVKAICQSKSTVVAKEKETSRAEEREILRAEEREILRAEEKEILRAEEREILRAKEQVVVGGSVKQRREEGNKSSRHGGSSDPATSVNEKNSRTAVDDVMTNQSSGGSNYGTSSREDFGGKERGERSRIKTNPWITSPFLSATHRQVTKDHQHVTGRQLVNDRQLICDRQSNIQSKTSNSNSSSSFGSTSSTDSGCAIFVPTNSSNAIHDVADHIYSNIMSPSSYSSSSSGHQLVILRNPRPVKECNLNQKTETGPYIIGQSLTDQSLSEQFTNSVVSSVSNRISCGSFTSTSGCCSSGISCDNVNNNSNGTLIDEVDQPKVDGLKSEVVKMGTFTKRKSEIRKRIEKRRESLPPTDEDDDEPSDSGRNSRRRSGTFTPKKSKPRHGTPNRRSSKLSTNDSLLSRSRKKNSLRNENGPSSPPPTPPPEASMCESLLHEVLSSIIPSRNGIYSREDISSSVQSPSSPSRNGIYSREDISSSAQSPSSPSRNGIYSREDISSSAQSPSSPSSSEDILLGSNHKPASKDSFSRRSSVFSCRSSSLSSDSEMIWTSNHSLYIHGQFPPPPTETDDFQKRFDEKMPQSSHKFHGSDTLTLDEKRASFWSPSSGSHFSSFDHDSLINNSLMDNESKRNSISSMNSRSSLSSTSTLTNGSTLTNTSTSNYICRKSRSSRNPFLKYFVGKRRNGGNSINEEWISTATELFDSDHESTSLDQINLNQRINSNQVANNRIKHDPNLCYEDEINCNDDEMDLKSSLTRASPFRISGHSRIDRHIDWRKNPFAKVRDSEKERHLRSDLKESIDKSDLKESIDNDHNNSSLQPSSSQFQDWKHQSKESSNGNRVVLRRGKKRQGMVEEQFNELLMNPSFLDWSVNSRKEDSRKREEEDSGKREEEDSGKREEEEEDSQPPSEDEDVPCPAPIDEILSRFSQQIRSSLIDPIENDCWDERQKEMEENLEGKKKREENHGKEEERSKMSSFHFEITTKCHENGHFTRDLIHEKEKSSFLPSLLPTSVSDLSQLPSSKRQDVRVGSGGKIPPLVDHSDSRVTENVNGHWRENSSPISGRNIYSVRIDTRIRGESQSLQHEVNDELSSDWNRFSEFSFTRNEEEMFGKNEEENSCHTSVISPGTVDSDSGLGVLLTCSDPATLLTPSSFATTISPTDSMPTETSATNNILPTDPFSSPSDDDSCNAFSLIDPIAASSDFSSTQRKGNSLEEKHEMKEKHGSIPSNGMKIERRMEEDSSPSRPRNEDEKNDLPSKLGKLRLELKDVVDVAINEVREEETRKREERILIKRKLVEEKRKILMDKLSQLKKQFNRD